MEPFSVAASILGLAGVGVQAAQTVQTAGHMFGDYRRAHDQMRHAEAKLDLLRSILQNESLKLNPDLAAAQSSFESIGTSFPRNLHSTTKRQRVRWAVKDKQRAIELCTQLSDLQTASSLSLLLGQSTLMIDIQSNLEELRDSLASVEEEIRGERKLHYTETPTPTITPQQGSQFSETRVHRWASSYFGANINLIVSRFDGQYSQNMILQCPLSSNRVLRVRVQSLRAPWPSLLIYPCFRIQNTVPSDSSMVKACQDGDTEKIQELISSGRANPNDMTVDRVTMLHFAILSGALDAVELLLDKGADPNLTYGKWETSPLNTAFYTGNAEIVQKLLDSGAELEYTNCRMWTSARYIFEPQRLHLNSTELLEFFTALEPSFWNALDRVGWTILHRAAAFGKAEDVQMIRSMQGSPNIRTIELNWLPISCAAVHGNEPTFDTLLADADLKSANRKDTRGWNLLHLAARGGSPGILTKVLRLGIDPEERTARSKLNLPDALKAKELTARDIADYYQKKDCYDQALKDTGWAA
ncbi:ankyrin [Mollisia scopiformis]|uniref:Ankyrin n=1 Tax=Mollisia scopiformis TaxID=149040 RepID=A0A194XMW6_MOLSC|nr:ankyrin [Mollisia scopiformis]KUJ21429.1 ankyrin [Mollisia scopiformis]